MQSCGAGSCLGARRTSVTSTWAFNGNWQGDSEVKVTPVVWSCWRKPGLVSLVIVVTLGRLLACRPLELCRMVMVGSGV